MAIKPNPWIRHVEAFVSPSSSSPQDADVDAIAAMVKDGSPTLLALVRDMELHLTATDHFIRGRGVTLLAEVVGRLSSSLLDAGTVHTLAQFFGARLADWHALHGALVGCLALLRRKHDVCTVVGSDAKAIAESFLHNVQVQLLALNDRKLCFEILECLLEIYRENVSSLDHALVDGICEAIDNEMDPRCLLLTFHLVESVVQLFPDPDGPIGSVAEDLFENLSCYFPIHFTHPNNDHPDIKRDDVSTALMHAFCSTPLFEPFAIPLLLDKLSSSLPSAKIDSLKYLSNCILCYGPDRMERHNKSIWYALKSIILSSPEQEPCFSETERKNDSPESQILKEAIKCLNNALSQENNNSSILNWIIEDKEFEMCFLSVSRETCYRNISVENRQLLSGIGSILGVCSKVSSQCCNIVFCTYLPRLMDILGISSFNTSFSQMNPEKSFRVLNYGALYLFIELLASCREMAVSDIELSMETIPGDNWFELLYNAHVPLSHVLDLFLSHGSIEENIMMKDIIIRVKGLQFLATFPPKMQMSKAVYEHILLSFMSIITARSNNSDLWKIVLESLVKIGSFIEKVHHSERRSIFMTIVVDKITSLFQFENPEMALLLKLEAAFSIGSICPAYMSKVTKTLEVLVFQNFVGAFDLATQNSAITLACLLQFYSRQVLPWYDTIGNLEEAMNFAVSIWNKMENVCFTNNTISTQEVCDALNLAMKTAVGICKNENQLLIMHKAYSTIQSQIISRITKLIGFPCAVSEIMRLPPDLITLTCSDELLVSLFAAVYIALRPQIFVPDVNNIMKWLMVFVLKGNVSAAQALGSIFNKWPKKVDKGITTVCSLEEVLDSTMFATELTSSNLCQTLNVNLIVGFAWMGKGLLMRGHDKVKEITMFFFRCMLAAEAKLANSDAAGNCNEATTSFILSRSAADAFHIFLSDSEACLNANFHAIIRPLYKQRFFSSVIPILLSSIKEYDSSNIRYILYRALGHIISNTPHAALIIETKKLILPLLECLSVLSGDIKDKDLLYSVLLVFSGILMDDDVRDIIVENVHNMTGCLAKLTAYPHMMLVREMAVQCLQALALLPYSRIYPMRQQVLKATSMALDDPKRRVRLEAARCRRTWLIYYYLLQSCLYLIWQMKLKDVENFLMQGIDCLTFPMYHTMCSWSSHQVISQYPGKSCKNLKLSHLSHVITYNQPVKKDLAERKKRKRADTKITIGA